MSWLDALGWGGSALLVVSLLQARVLRVHAPDIARFQPDFDPGGIGAASGSAAYLLDHVTPRFRDFSPGEFVWRRGGLLLGAELRRVVTPPNMVAAHYDRLGFRREGQSFVLDL